MKAGSSIIITNTGVTRTETQAPQGSIYVAQTATLFPAFEVAWGKVDSSGGLASSPDFTVQFAGAATQILGGILPASYWARGPINSTRGYNYFSGNAQRLGLSTVNNEGVDSGCDLALLTYHDDGSFKDAAFVCERSTAGYFFLFRSMDIAAPYLYTYAGVPVMGPRRTGWGLPSGTASRATFDTTTVTTEELAQRFYALMEDLFPPPTYGHGLIGP